MKRILILFLVFGLMMCSKSDEERVEQKPPIPYGNSNSTVQVECFSGAEISGNNRTGIKRMYGNGVKFTQGDEVQKLYNDIVYLEKDGTITFWGDSEYLSPNGITFTSAQMAVTGIALDTLLQSCSCTCTNLSGGGGSGDVIQSAIYNGSTFTITTDQGQFNVVVNANNIQTVGSITIGGTTLPAGTSIETVLNAIETALNNIDLIDNGNNTFTFTNATGSTTTFSTSGGGGPSHPEATITNNNSPFAWNSTTQQGNIPLPDFTFVGNTLTLDKGDGSAALNVNISGGATKEDYPFSTANLSGHIWGSSTGITVSEQGGGVVRVSVPAATDIFKINIAFPASYTNSNAIYLQFTYADVRTYNTSPVNVNAPIVRLENATAVGANRTSPDFSDGANTSKGGKYGCSAFGNIGAGGTTDIEMAVNDAAQGSNTLLIAEFTN